jgi:hypothetical protein
VEGGSKGEGGDPGMSRKDILQVSSLGRLPQLIAGFPTSESLVLRRSASFLIYLRIFSTFKIHQENEDVEKD